MKDTNKWSHEKLINTFWHSHRSLSIINNPKSHNNARNKRKFIMKSNLPAIYSEEVW